MTGRVRWWYGVVAVAVLAGIVVTLSWRSGDTGPTAMQVVVSPHPDDELQGWALISDAERLHTVFVVMTEGEATGNCNGVSNLQEEWGERPPEPQPGPADQGTDRCGAARMDSWHDFLDRVSEAGEPRAEMEEWQPRLGSSATVSTQVWRGTWSTRVAVDAGDGSLTAQIVESTVRDVLALQGGGLPDLPVRRIIATAYFNDSAAAGSNRLHDGCAEGCDGDRRDLEYEHPDHAAVNEAAAELAPLASGGAWLVTHRHDDEADRRKALTPETYEELMGLGERLGPEADSFKRVGAHQVSYGWLSFPGSYWPTGRTATSRNDVLFPRVQFFRHVEGAS